MDARIRNWWWGTVWVESDRVAKLVAVGGPLGNLYDCMALWDHLGWPIQRHVVGAHWLMRWSTIDDGLRLRMLLLWIWFDGLLLLLLRLHDLRRLIWVPRSWRGLIIVRRVFHVGFSSSP